MSDGLLMICVATQSAYKGKSEVVAYAVDPKLDFEVRETFRLLWSQK